MFSLLERYWFSAACNNPGIYAGDQSEKQIGFSLDFVRVCDVAVKKPCIPTHADFRTAKSGLKPMKSCAFSHGINAVATGCCARHIQRDLQQEHFQNRFVEILT